MPGWILPILFSIHLTGIGLDSTNKSSNKFSKYILSFEKASADHGGDGAFYVYLRKKKS